MRQPLNVFFAIGKYFIRYFSVSVISLIENNKHLDLHIFLIYDFEDKSLLDEIVKHLANKYNITISLLYQDSSIFADYRIAKHVSINTYLRLLLPVIIPQDIDSGLFLDSDTVVSGALDSLASFKFAAIDADVPESEKYIAAVREIPEQNEANVNRLAGLGYATDKYFNAGVMLVSLKNWRLTNASKELLKIAADHMQDLVFWDQDILNIYFANHWYELNKTYNALHLIWKRPETPKIIHFAGSSKPWNYLDRHPYKSAYFKYLAMSPYKNDKYVDFYLKKAPYKYYRDLRHFLNYFRQLVIGNIQKINNA